MLLNDTLGLLSNEYKRKMMYALHEHEDDVIGYDELIENMVEEDYMRHEERERFKTQMYHSHLPSMQESGVIEYDDEAEIIREIPDDDVEELLEFVQRFEE